MKQKIYNIEYPNLGVKQQKLLISHQVYLDYLSLPYETKEEQSFAKRWLKRATLGMEWFTEKSPFFEAIESGVYKCNLKENLEIKVYNI